MSTSVYLETHSMGWLITIPVVTIENLIALVIISSRKRWKSPDVLLFSITLGHVLSLLLPLLLYAVITFTKTNWSDGSCKFLVWCVMSFRIVGAVNIAFISLDRVWTLKWPSSYRSHNSSRQTARTAVFMWLFGVAIGTIPLISWSSLEADQTCSLVLNIAGYGYAMCIVIIILGSVIVSTGCICTIVVNVAYVWPLLEESSDPKDTIPHIVIESETGERTSAVVGSRDSQNKQIYYLVSTVVVLYFCINGLPFVVINIIAFTAYVPAHWMSVTITWCSIVSGFLHPPLLLLICNRYKKVCVRFFRYVGETCGCIHVTPTRPRMNGMTRQETFDSLDDFSSDEEDKLHFPSPDWSDRSFCGSVDEPFPGPSSQAPNTSSTSPANTFTEAEPSHVTQNGKLPPKKTSTSTHSPSAKYTQRKDTNASTSRNHIDTGGEYDNAAFIEDEGKKNKSKKQRSPKLTPEQKRAIWQGHKGARKRLEALKQANAERAAANHSKGKKSRSKTRHEKDPGKMLKVDEPNKNKHRRLERLSTRQHSLDSLTLPTKRQTPLLTSKSFDQSDHMVTVKVDIENNATKNIIRDQVREKNEKEKSLTILAGKSDSEPSRGKKKHKKSEGKSEWSGKKDSSDSKPVQKDQKLSMSPNTSPSSHDKPKPDSALRGPRFEIARENYNSDFSSFGSGELYDIPEESPEEMLGEVSGWSPTTVRAIRTQHDLATPHDRNHTPRKRRDRERQRPRMKVDHQESPTLQAGSKRSNKGFLSRQVSQDHSRSMEMNTIEMTEFNNKGSLRNGPFGDVNDQENSILSEEPNVVEETSVDNDQSKYTTPAEHGVYSEGFAQSDDRESPTDQFPSIRDMSQEDRYRAVEEARSNFTLQTQAWASMNTPSRNSEHSLDHRGRLNKSRSAGDRPSAKDMRERYRKSHLSMAAIFESIRDDGQEVVYL